MGHHCVLHVKFSTAFRLQHNIAMFCKDDQNLRSECPLKFMFYDDVWREIQNSVGIWEFSKPKLLIQNYTARGPSL